MQGLGCEKGRNPPASHRCVKDRNDHPKGGYYFGLPSFISFDFASTHLPAVSPQQQFCHGEFAAKKITPPSSSPAPPPMLCLLLRLEVIQQHIPFLAFLAPISHNNAAAVDDFSGISFPVEDAEAGPLTEQLSIRHFDERDFVFGT